MPFSDNHRSPFPLASFRRPIMSFRSDHIHSETNNDSHIQGLDIFQRKIFSRFHDLSVVDSNELLSISWINKLLDAFTSCQEEFQVILTENKSLLSKSPSDKLASEFFERSIKAMDICNATRDGLEVIRVWQKHLEIVLNALDCKQRLVGESHFRRARKALMDLALVMLGDKEASSVLPQRNRSFGRKGKDHVRPSSGHSRSPSWSVSSSWSASKQLQSIASSLVPPRANDIASTNGIALLVFSMSFVLMFVLWALVASIPCQDRGVHNLFTIPRNYSWSTPLFLIQSRILDESKKKDRRNTSGLLKEIYKMENLTNQITELVDSAKFPLSEEMKEEVREKVQDLSLVCEVCKNGLSPLEQRLREVFRKITNCRTEGLELLDKATETKNVNQSSNVS